MTRVKKLALTAVVVAVSVGWRATAGDGKATPKPATNPDEQHLLPLRAHAETVRGELAALDARRAKLKADLDKADADLANGTDRLPRVTITLLAADKKSAQPFRVERSANGRSLGSARCDETGLGWVLRLAAADPDGPKRVTVQVLPDEGPTRSKSARFEPVVGWAVVETALSAVDRAGFKDVSVHVRSEVEGHTIFTVLGGWSPGYAEKTCSFRNGVNLARAKATYQSVAGDTE